MGERTCSEAECKEQSYCRGLCKLHYGRAYRAGALPPLQLEIPLKPLHSLSNINKETRRAQCAICGPGVRIRLRSGRGAECQRKRRDPARPEFQAIMSTCKAETPEQRRKYALKMKYGLSPERYAEMVEAQGGRCLICQQVPDILVVDHDHACCSGKRRTCGKCVRGLLCRECNLALGYLKDLPGAAVAAASYLAK